MINTIMDSLLVGINAQDNATPVFERFRRTVSDVSSSSVGSLAAFGLVAAGITKSIQLVGSAISVALGPSMEMEKLTTQFEVLLGSTGEAKARMEELTKFADTTPFELTEVAKASKTLETLTKGALSTGPGLRLVGDAAAASGESFESLSVHIGRLYDGLDSGRPVGESLSRLQELGLVSGETRGQIEKLQKEGKKGPEVWKVAAGALGEYGGMMDKQAATFGGLASTFQDSVNGVLREFGSVILPDAKNATKDLTQTLNEIKPAAEVFGWVVGSLIKLFRGFIVYLKYVGQVHIPLIISDIGKGLMDGLKVILGFAAKVNSVLGGLLPASISKGLTSGLQSASDWANGMSDIFGTVIEDSKATAKELGAQVLDIYRPEEEEFDTGTGKKKKKGGSKSSGGDGKERAKAIQAENKTLEEIIKAHQKSNQEIYKIRSQMVLDSINDNKEKEVVALNQRVEEEEIAAWGNKELLTAIHEKYRQDIRIINKKYDKVELQDKIKAIDKQIEAEEKKRDITKENLKKSQEDLKELLSKQQATIDSYSSKASELLTSPFDKFNKSIASGNHSLKSSFSNLFSSIQDNFGNMLSNMVAQLMTKAAIFGVLNLLSAGGVGVATTGLSNFSWFAAGTNYAPGGPTVVGENGPELVNLPRGSQVIPNNQISNYSNNGGNTYNVNISNSGYTPKEIVREIKTMERQNTRTRRA